MGIQIIQKYLHQGNSDMPYEVNVSLVDKSSLILASVKVPSTYRSFLDGSIINEDNLVDFANKLRESEYVTDHVILETQLDGVTFLHVCLDNSIRAIDNGYPVSKRIDVICNALNNCISGDTVVFFADACLAEWDIIKPTIENKCNLICVDENNNGMATFATKNDFIAQIISKTVATGVKMNSNRILWAARIPKDFSIRNNKQDIAVKELTKIVEETEESVAIIGNFKAFLTTPAAIAVYKHLPTREMKVINKTNMPTFFGSPFDLVLHHGDENLQRI